MTFCVELKCNRKYHIDSNVHSFEDQRPPKISIFQAFGLYSMLRRMKICQLKIERSCWKHMKQKLRRLLGNEDRRKDTYLCTPKFVVR